MIKVFKKSVLFLLAVVFFVSTVQLNCFADQDTEATAKYVLSKTPMPISASVGGEWAVIGIKRAGVQPNARYFENYITRARAKLDSGEEIGKKYTEYSRIALAFSALGEDVKEYGILSYINDYDNVIVQGINGPIYALEAKYAAGDMDTETRDRYINYILSCQNADGSFGLSQNIPDADITAMAIGALCRYKDTNPKIYNAVNRAFLYLSSVQHSNGGFNENSYDTEISCESTAQVIIAMKRYGLDENCGFFTKNGCTPYTALSLFRCESGGYKHKTYDSQENQMSTEQALLALTEPKREPAALKYDSIWFDANLKYIESLK